MFAESRRLLFPAICASVIATWLPSARADQSVHFEPGDGKLLIELDNQPIATYIYSDSNIPRPYFAHVMTLEGIQVTRNHPPIAGQDATDHATFHPGIWMAFGDLGGSDFWRNRAEVRHVRFIEEPVSTSDGGRFVEEKQYLRPDGSLICTEEFRCAIHPFGSGYLLVWDSTFRGKDPFYFGDQEEMGLGLRVATPISEVHGGRLRDSEGRSGAAAIWSNAARWCDYSGKIDGRRVGMTIFCHPKNFRHSWMHARNYGLLVANPFGRQAMHQGEPAKLVIEPGRSLRLRYAISIHSGAASEETTYQVYLRLARVEP